MLLWWLLAVPMACAATALLLKETRTILSLCIIGAIAELALIAGAVWRVAVERTLFAAGKYLFLDALSAFHLTVVGLVFTMASLYARSYFITEESRGEFSAALARRYATMWFTFLTSMVLVLISNNLGVLWAAMEATTLASTFLISIQRGRHAVEAAWKYLVICSVGIAFALFGTVLFYNAAYHTNPQLAESFLWTQLNELAAGMDPKLVRLAFLFIVAGFGTKAGLAPMHTWLPDAHSQAPTPVSAVLSGVLLNCALYSVTRYLPLVAATTGAGWPSTLLVGFGIFSIAVAAPFIIVQRDIKRMLAYSSVEHIGVMALGFGLGAAGTFAALLHTLNHSLCKSLMFFSAGKVVQTYHTREMNEMQGALRGAPLAATGLLLGAIALTGSPPFGLFVSEFLTARAALAMERPVTLILFLTSLVAIFAGFFFHIARMVYGRAPRPVQERGAALGGYWLIPPLIITLFILGVFLPEPLRHALTSAANIVQGISLAAGKGQ